MRSRSLRLATRGSPLALVQAESVAGRLAAAGAGPCELVVVETRADRRLDVPIGAFAGQGAFVAEVERAVAEGRADVAVHSAKDLPSSLPTPGLVLAAVPERFDPRDVLVGGRLDDLPPGAIVASGAARRRAQLAWLRPDLGFVELRGNIGTRLAKIPPGGAAVVAAAALARLHVELDVEHEVLPVSLLLPQVGQGALALRCRDDDAGAIGILSEIDDLDAHLALRAERALLARLGGGCDTPVGAYATVSHGQPGAQPLVLLEGLLASRDGHALARRRRSGADPERLGAALADDLVGAGGGLLMLGRTPPW